MLIEVSLQEFTITGIRFKVTALLPCEAPKPVPLITTSLPALPVVAETVAITGAGVAAKLTDTLSKVAMASEGELLPPFTKTQYPRSSSC